MVLRDCVRDLRYSWRQFAATPMVACVAVITLAIGIGANAAIFSLLDTALLQTLPVHDPGSLRTVEVVTRSGVEMSNIPSEFFNELRKEPRSFSGVFGFFREQLNFDTGGDIDRVLVQMVSGGYYSTLGFAVSLDGPLTSRMRGTANALRCSAIRFGPGALAAVRPSARPLT